MTDNILFKPSDYDRTLWDYQTKVNPRADRTQETGLKRYQSFDTFAGEIFHKMYSDDPQRVDTPPAGSDVFQKLHSCIEQIPEIADL